MSKSIQKDLFHEQYELERMKLLKYHVIPACSKIGNGEMQPKYEQELKQLKDKIK